ncbi:hypothetical protein LSAT2_003776 [Lamellibrachia satsuma]|nr:hypothetical protein LSAT2_003776 [Lamellibrachia satsuma]
MVRLLEGQQQLLNDPTAQQAVRDIRQIETTTLDVRDAALLTQERQAWQQVISNQSLANRQDILNLIASNAALEIRLHAEIAEVIRTLGGNVHDLDSRLAGVEGDLQTTNRKVEAVEVQSQEATHQLRQQATQLEVHDQLLQDVRAGHEKMTVQSQEATHQLRQQATRLDVHEQQLQDVRAGHEKMTVQGQEATHHLQQQASQLDDHEQQLQDVKRTQETMTGDLQTTNRKVAVIEVQSQEATHELRQQATQLEAHVQLLQDVSAGQEKMTDELKTFEKHLKDVQRHRIADYLSKKDNEDEHYTVKDLNELYVDLRIHNKKDNYKRVESRTHHDLLELQKDVDTCDPVGINDLFRPGREGAFIPKRLLHPRFKAKEIGVNDNVVGQLREPLLNHATLARDGMGESPIKVTFSEDEIKALHLEEAAIECGLLTVSKEKKGTVLRKHSSIYTFNHLTVQELLGAVALVSSPQKAESMMVKSANDGQLDLLLMFLCGLISDHVNKKFLDTLGCQINMTPERLLQLVIQREYEKTERHRIQMIADSSISVHDKSIHIQFDRQQSALLMLLMIFESQHPELWSTVKDYAKEDDDTLNLSHMHISPVELQAMTFIFQNSDFNSLKLGFCQLSGREVEKLASELSKLRHLKHLSLYFNDFSDPASSDTLVENVLKMTSLQTLDLRSCHISAGAMKALAGGLRLLTTLKTLFLSESIIDAAAAGQMCRSLPHLSELEILWLESCHIDDASAVDIATMTVELPRLHAFVLQFNHVTDDGKRRMKEILCQRTKLDVLWENCYNIDASAVDIAAKLSQLLKYEGKFCNVYTSAFDNASIAAGLPGLRIFVLEKCLIEDASAVDIAAIAAELPHAYGEFILRNIHLTDDGQWRVRDILCLKTELEPALAGQQPPPVETWKCASLCEGGRYELFYQRPLSQVTLMKTTPKSRHTMSFLTSALSNDIAPSDE